MPCMYSRVSFRMTLSEIFNTLAKYSITRSIARPLCDSWAFCFVLCKVDLTGHRAWSSTFFSLLFFSSSFEFENIFYTNLYFTIQYFNSPCMGQVHQTINCMHGFRRSWIKITRDREIWRQCGSIVLDGSTITFVVSIFCCVFYVRIHTAVELTIQRHYRACNNNSSFDSL